LGYFNGTIQQWGSVGTSNESQNVYQILDNVTRIVGNHSLKFGVSFQAVRFFYRYAPASLGQYYYNPVYTGAPGVSFTGWGVADFLADQINGAYIANAPNINDAQWYDSAYVQDDWKITPRLTLNLGVRYDYFRLTRKWRPASQLRCQPAHSASLRDLVSISSRTRRGT